MAGFFSKLFGGGEKKDSLESVVEATLNGILENANFDLSYELNLSKKDDITDIKIEFSGGDEALLKDYKGQLLDAFQLIVKRVTQHHFADLQTNVIVDCGGYREESDAALIERAEHLKTIAIEQGKSVYYRALPPKERKVVHQYLALDGRVKSRSLGDGLYKKIKIYPAKGPNSVEAEVNASDE
jgi:spoIIIJ-associated protein